MDQIDNLDSNNSYIEVELNCCCICLTCSEPYTKNNNNKFITLDCCQQRIHILCILDWMLSTHNRYLQCPMCRASIDYLNKLITMNDFLAYVQNNYTVYDNVYNDFNDDFNDNYESRIRQNTQNMNSSTSKKMTSNIQLSKLVNLLYSNPDFTIRIEHITTIDRSHTIVTYIFLFFIILPIICVLGFFISHILFME